MALSDRILVMSNGRITAEFGANEATQDALVAASAIGHRVDAHGTGQRAAA
jgi:erythritol transport system ATP-binding protein